MLRRLILCAWVCVWVTVLLGKALLSLFLPVHIMIASGHNLRQGISACSACAMMLSCRVIFSTEASVAFEPLATVGDTIPLE